MGRSRPPARIAVGALTAVLALTASACGGGARGGAGASGASTTSAPGASTTTGHATPSSVSARPPISAAHKLRLSSPAFASGATIPARFTCAGADVSPPLNWSGVPSDARELALVMIDPDAPSGPFIHWLLAGIPPTDTGLPAHLGLTGAVPGRNDFGKLLYRGPCPPAGKPHHYVIELLALRAPSGLTPGFPIAALKRLHPSAAGVLVGVFGRH